MTCADFENLLLEYPELTGAQREAADSHLSNCAECRAFLAALESVDDSLARAYAPVTAPEGFRESILARTQSRKIAARPSRIPEILDFVGWAAVAGVTASAVTRMADTWELPDLTLWAACAAAVTIAVVAGLRSWVELRG